ncbi:MAG: hypothetical protein ABI895_35425 [Deltaproteobacteria bacterium]
MKIGRRAAVVVRSGCALRVDFGDGARLSITVDDAETAARLINGLVLRRAHEREQGIQSDLGGRRFAKAT